MTFNAPDTDAVLAALASAASVSSPSLKTWERRVVRSDNDGHCAYCLAPLPPLLHRKAVINTLVPVSLGGPAIKENRVLCCVPCARRKGHTDLVAWPALAAMEPAHRDHLLALRSQVLLMARNHLTPHSSHVPLPTVIDHLAKRFEHPRFRVYAAQSGPIGWIGWTPTCGADVARQQAAGMLRWTKRARVLSRHNLTLFELPAELFLEAVWQLIDHHAIVSHLPLGNLPAPIASDDWRYCWERTFDQVSDLRRRHSRVDPVVAPSSPPSASKSAKARWKRKRDANLAQENHTRAWQQAQLELDQLKVERAAGRLPGADGLDLWEQSGEVLRLKAKALGVQI